MRPDGTIRRRKQGLIRRVVPRAWRGRASCQAWKDSRRAALLFQREAGGSPLNGDSWSMQQKENRMNHENMSFAESVRRSLLPDNEDAEALWASLAQEFTRGGPDAANEHLAAEKQGLVERVHRLLGDVEGRIDG